MLPRRFYFDNALDQFFDEGNSMKCDIYEKDNTYHVEMDLPGFKKDEIKIEFEVVYPPGFDKAWLFSRLAEDENVMTIME